jgi:uncharacterized protein with FMN-binding domain
VRVRAAVVGVLGSALVLGGSWQVGTLLGPATSKPATTPSVASSPPPGAATVSGSFTGASERTQYGNVQVKLVVVAGRITDVVALKLTDQGGRSVQLSNMAAPILRSEVLKSQSAKVSSVGGATYTTDAYLLSVQSAIDKAHI